VISKGWVPAFAGMTNVPLMRMAIRLQFQSRAGRREGRCELAMTESQLPNRPLRRMLPP
jgi:hypothetical protein